MLSRTIECHTTTSAPPDFVDLTEDIRAAVETCGVIHGRVTVFAPDDRCAILVNERETGLLQDIRAAIARLSNGSGDALIIGSSSVVLPVVDGALRLGTWQRVLLVEMGAASDRTVSVQIVGEEA